APMIDVGELTQHEADARVGRHFRAGRPEKPQVMSEIADVAGAIRRQIVHNLDRGMAPVAQDRPARGRRPSNCGAVRADVTTISAATTAVANAFISVTSDPGGKRSPFVACEYARPAFSARDAGLVKDRVAGRGSPRVNEWRSPRPGAEA